MERLLGRNAKGKRHMACHVLASGKDMYAECVEGEMGGAWELWHCSVENLYRIYRTCLAGTFAYVTEQCSYIGYTER